MATTKTENELTLRDTFAMSALNVLSGGSWNGTPCNMIFEDKYNLKHKMAIDAYLIADEMLKVRDIPNLQEYHSQRTKS